MVSLSYSSIDLYLRCPLQYKLGYIDRLKRKPKHYFSFGSSLHEAVENFYSLKVGEPPTLKEFLETYKKNWVSEGYENQEQEQAYFRKGQEILTEFYRLHAADYRMPFTRERSFNLTINGINFAGVIDKVEKLPEGTLEVIDYKSGDEPPDRQRMKKDLQLSIYHLAVEENWGIPVEKLTLYHLNTNTPISVPGRKKEELEETKRIIADIAHKIERQEFQPNYDMNKCPCDWPEYCPYFKHKFEKEKPQKELTTPTAEEIAAIVDDYGELYKDFKSQEKEIKARLDEIKEIILEYCENARIEIVYGQNYKIQRSKRKKITYDEENIQSILESAHLLDKVLKFDKKLFEEFLKDEGIDEDLRNKLDKFVQFVIEYALNPPKKINEE